MMQRYGIYVAPRGDCGPVPDDGGAWVRYEDAAAATERAESWLKQTEEQVVQQRLRAEEAEAQRDELAEVAAFAESGRKEMKAERDEARREHETIHAAACHWKTVATDRAAQIAALRAKFEEAVLVIDHELDDDMRQRSPWKGWLSKWRQCLSDIAADAEDGGE